MYVVRVICVNAYFLEIIYFLYLTKNIICVIRELYEKSIMYYQTINIMSKNTRKNTRKNI